MVRGLARPRNDRVAAAAEEELHQVQPGKRSCELGRYENGHHATVSLCKRLIVD